MGSKNLPIEDWSDEQKRVGIVQIHVQTLHVINGKVHNGASITINTLACEGLFASACKSAVELGLGIAPNTGTSVPNEGT